MGLSNPLHILILVLVVVLLFGARRLPELGKSLGSGIREFKGSLDGREQDQVDPPQASATVPAPSAPVAAPVQARPADPAVPGPPA